MAAEDACPAHVRRSAILHSLKQVNLAIVQWRRIAQNTQLPISQRRPLPYPPLSLATYEELRRQLLEELAHLDEGSPPAPGEQPSVALD
jgi:hypothetical protein